MRLAILCLLLVPALGIPQVTPPLAADADSYARTVEPFFTTCCANCHSGGKPKGSFGVDAKGLPNDFSDLATPGKWNEVVNILNSHEMPPKGEKQPAAKEVAAVVDWITAQAVLAEVAKRETAVVLRRLNRDEYRNTVRDLLGLDFDVSGFPADPAAGGFDNNGGALTVSPLHVETYLNAGRQLLDRALVEGERPKAVKWRFDPQVGPADRTRVKLDAQNNPLVNGGNNATVVEWVMVHHDQWDKCVGARDFRVPVAGTYNLRLRAAGRVPDRDEVVKSAEAILARRRDDQTKQNPRGRSTTTNSTTPT